MVVVFVNAGGNKAKIKVHALGTNSWKIVQMDIPVPVDGTLNRLEDKDYHILSFNLDVLRDCLCILACRRDFFMLS